MSLEGRTIVLDPSHGEVKGGVNDSGAVNKSLDRTELDEVRKQADLIKAIRQSKGSSVKIVENNTGKRLAQIGSEGAGSHCFVSLHLNAFDQVVQGREVLVDTKGTVTDEKLAALINEELDRQLDIPNRGVKRKGLGVLKGVPLPVPAVLVESFFIDSVRDAASLDRLIGASAKAIAAGIERFLLVGTSKNPQSHQACNARSIAGTCLLRAGRVGLVNISRCPCLSGCRV